MTHRCSALLALVLGLQVAHAQPARTPRQLIDHLGVEIRQSLEEPKAAKTPEDLERAVADQIAELIRTSPGHLSLTLPGKRGRTPLMQAAGNGYALVVQALLADPSVRLRINQPDDDGATAWMLANFAPTLTLVSCEPGTLTVERYQLLPPYLKRMAYLLKTKGAALGAVVNQLQEAGADANPEEAKRLWLARCPNAAPDLRDALASGELMQTLINDALARQRDFNKLAHDSPRKIPLMPPKGMQFIHADEGSSGRRRSPLLAFGQMTCVRMNKPELPNAISWSGTITLRAIVATRGGVVEAADFQVLTQDADSRVADYFRGVILRALAGYQCEGDHIFEQEFQFNIR